MDLDMKKTTSGIVIFALALLGVMLEAAADQRLLLKQSHDRQLKVAIIGAGAAGASAAYFLHQHIEKTVPVDIVIFEASSYVGGRAKTICVGAEDCIRSVEVGAAHFSEDNAILNSLVEETGLRPESTEGALKDGLAIWNGSTFLYSQEEGELGWWRDTNLAWKYHLAPYLTRRLVKQTSEKLRSNFRHASNAYSSAAEFLRRSSLVSAAIEPAEAFLQKNGISQPFTGDIIQAATRAVYSQNLDAVNGLAALGAMTEGRRISLHQGNWRLFDRMIKLAEACKRLRTRVTSIDRHENKTFSVSWTQVPMDVTESKLERRTEIFDSVIIAAPFHHTGITISPPLPKTPSPKSFITNHVTVFTSAHPISANSLKLQPATRIPSAIWTSPGLHIEGLPFFSLMRRETTNRDGCVIYPEYTYTIVSPEPINDSVITQLLDLSTDPFSYVPTQPINLTDPNLPPDPPIRWIHREVWQNAYPLLEPQSESDLDDVPVELAPNLYYTSSLEPIIGTSLELSAYMGRNVAELLWSKWREPPRDLEL